MASAKLTALQKELQRSRRLLNRKDTLTETAESESRSPPSSLHRYIRERNMPTIEPAAPAPCSDSTERTLARQRDDEFAHLASSRMSRLRQRSSGMDRSASEDGLVPLDTPAWLLVDSDDPPQTITGLPVWREVLNDQRSYIRPSESARAGHARLTGGAVQGESPVRETEWEVRQSLPEWPTIFTPDELHRWELWETGPENRLATVAARDVIINPASHSNPLIVLGPAGVGKTHLIQAVAASIHLRHTSGVVRSLNAIEMEQPLPPKWYDSLTNCTALFVDDISRITGFDAVDRLGQLLDLAIDLGIQVMAAGESIPPLEGRFAEVMKSAVVVEISPPEKMTITIHLRNMALRRMLPLSDEQLTAIVDHSGADWRSAESALEKVAVALEAGAEPLDAEDITSILLGDDLPMREDDVLMGWDSEETGRRIVSDVLDEFLPRENQPNVEYISRMGPVRDDYQPPELMPESSEEAVDSLLERHLGREKGAVEEARRTVAEAGRATELESPQPKTPTIDVMGEAFLDRLESRLHRHQNELFSLHEEMEQIAHNIEDADTKVLVGMVDRMLEIERSLARISRLESGEPLMARKKPERPYQTPSMDEFIPLGEWDVDVDSVSASDLIEDVRAPLHPITTLQPLKDDSRTTISPVTVLVPLEGKMSDED